MQKPLDFLLGRGVEAGGEEWGWGDEIPPLH